MYYIASLNKKGTKELRQIADAFGIERGEVLSKSDLISLILEAQEKSSNANDNDEEYISEDDYEIYVTCGVLEVTSAGYGFLRNNDSSHNNSSDLIYVAQIQISRMGLKSGDVVKGTFRPPKNSEAYSPLINIIQVNGKDPSDIRNERIENDTPKLLSTSTKSRKLVVIHREEDSTNVQSHNFEAAKRSIQEFGSTIPDNVCFSKYEENGLLWLDKKITGEEMNNFLIELQKNLFQIYQNQGKVIGQFTQVYNALEALDEDYIKGIISALKGAEESSKQALSAGQKALENSNENKRIIDILKHTIDQVKEANEKALNNESDTARVIESLKTTIQRLLNDENDFNQKYLALERSINKLQEGCSVKDKIVNTANTNDRIGVSLEEYFNFKQSTNTKLFVAYSVSGISLILVLLKMFGIL